MYGAYRPAHTRICYWNRDGWQDTTTSCSRHSQVSSCIHTGLARVLLDWYVCPFTQPEHRLTRKRFCSGIPWSGYRVCIVDILWGIRRRCDLYSCKCPAHIRSRQQTTDLNIPFLPKQLREKNGGVPKPEMRVPPLIIASLFVPIVLLWVTFSFLFLFFTTEIL